MAPIERITLFKVPKEEDRLRLLEQYKVLAKTATKVRRPNATISAIAFPPPLPRPLRICAI
jgi:hypothetical protein